MTINIIGDNRPQVGGKVVYSLRGNLLIPVAAVKWSLFEGAPSGQKPLLEKTTGEFIFNQKSAGHTYTLQASYLSTSNYGKTEVVSLTVIPVPGKPLIQKITWLDINDKDIGSRVIGYLDRVQLVVQTSNIPENDRITVTVYEDEYADGHGDSSREMGTYNLTIKKNGQGRLIFPHLSMYQKKLNKADYIDEAEHEYYVKVNYSNKIETIRDKTWLKVKNEFKQLVKADVKNKPVTVKKAPENTVQKVINAQSVVQFRPKQTWNGNKFGFDWMREGDSDLPGDNVAHRYEKIIGKYAGDVFQPNPGQFMVLETLYPFVSIPWKLVARLPKKYYVPWLSLFTGVTAALKILIEVKTAAERLKIRYANEYFELNIAGGSKEADKSDPKFSFLILPAAAKAVTGAGNLRKLSLTVKCLKDFPKDQLLEVYAEEKQLSGLLLDKLAGKLLAVANQRKHTLNVVFVNVPTLINGGTVAANGLIQNSAFANQQKEYLKKFMKQALITLNIETVDFNRTTDRYLMNYYTISTLSGKILNKYRNGGGIPLGVYLETSFNAVPQNSKYLDYYKIFFFGEDGGRVNPTTGSITMLGGFANDIPSKSAVMLAGPQPFFVTHELMHCLNLQHSFENASSATFQKGRTDNIMDYSHISWQESPGVMTPIITQISSWKWQWEILQKSAT